MGGRHGCSQRDGRGILEFCSSMPCVIWVTVGFRVQILYITALKWTVARSWTSSERAGGMASFLSFHHSKIVSPPLQLSCAGCIQRQDDDRDRHSRIRPSWLEPQSTHRLAMATAKQAPEWQWPLSGVYSVMRIKSAQAGEGGSARLPRFTISTITYKVVVYGALRYSATLQ